MEPLFDHEKLEVYQRAIQFAGWSVQILEQLPKSSSAYDQLDRASTSIPLNIAEGNGKWSKKDRYRFFDIAKGSALECAAILDTCAAKKLISENDALSGKRTLLEIVRMLIGLIQANDPERHLGKGALRVGEEEHAYTVAGEKDKE